MTRKSDRQNQRPSIQSVIAPPTKTGPKGKEVDLTFEVDRKATTPVVEMSDVPGEFEPASEVLFDYHFDITVYSNENLRRTAELIRNKGRGHCWDFFDPEDLANVALTKLWKYLHEHPDCCQGKVSIDKIFSTMVVRIWIREVRRELRKRNLRGSGSLCVSLFSDLNLQVADLGQEFEAALRELLDHVKANLSHRQKQIVDLRLEKRNLSEIALKLNVSDVTIDREIVSIKKAIVSRLGEQRTTDNGQRTTDNGQRTTDNEQRATSNEQRATSTQPALRK